MPKQCYAHFLVNFFFWYWNLTLSYLWVVQQPSINISFLSLFQLVKVSNFFHQYLQYGWFQNPIYSMYSIVYIHSLYSIYISVYIYIYIFIYLCIVSISMSSDHRNGSTIRFFFHLNNQTSLVLMKHEVLTFTSLATDIHTWFHLKLLQDYWNYCRIFEEPRSI